MYESSEFSRSYFENLQKLDLLVSENKNVRLGEKLVFLIEDFVKTLTDWNKEILTKSASGELYKKSWTEVRNFVLPINPQRTELEYAIRKTLKNLGVNIKIPKNIYLTSKENIKKVSKK